jgi:DNA modification methylase
MLIKKKKRPFTPEPKYRSYETDRYTLYHGNCFHVFPLIESNSVDSWVVDGPYALGFMGNEWDSPRHIEPDAKSAGGFGKDAPTNVNAYGAARVRYGNLGKHFTERPAKQKLREQGRNRATDSPLPLLATGGEIYQEFSEKWAREVYRVLKPGGYLLSFGGTRTYHRMVCGLEDAGFEIRDQIDWIYGSGFPKSQDFAKDLRRGGTMRDAFLGSIWGGWGTALKPAHEPICLARKPFKGTVANNVLANGVGGLNIEGCRVGTYGARTNANNGKELGIYGRYNPIGNKDHETGRWPSNVILSPEVAEVLDRQSGFSRTKPTIITGSKRSGGILGKSSTDREGKLYNYSDSGGASRFFYCAKPSKRERDLGLEHLTEQAWVQFQTANGTSKKASSISEGRNTKKRNVHPTVKPIELMRYLVRLITPPGGTIGDHFMGSGTTGIGAILEGFHFIGIENYPEYFPIAKARLDYWSRHADKEQETS